MKFLTTLNIALRALAKNKMRAALTVLGVVIGIAAVTAMVSIGQSAGALVRGELESFGTNVIVIQPAARERSGVRSGLNNTLTSKDCAAIAKRMFVDRRDHTYRRHWRSSRLWELERQPQ